MLDLHLHAVTRQVQSDVGARLLAVIALFRIDRNDADFVGQFQDRHRVVDRACRDGAALLPLVSLVPPFELM